MAQAFAQQAQNSTAMGDIQRQMNEAQDQARHQASVDAEYTKADRLLRFIHGPHRVFFGTVTITDATWRK